MSGKLAISLSAGHRISALQSRQCGDGDRPSAAQLRSLMSRDGVDLHVADIASLMLML